MVHIFEAGSNWRCIVVRSPPASFHQLVKHSRGGSAWSTRGRQLESRLLGQ